MSNHSEQIAFVEARDGKAAALVYAKQCIVAWRKVTKRAADGRKQFAHDKIFREHFVLSILFARNYLRVKS